MTLKIFGEFILGLGLFFIALDYLSNSLKQFASRKFRILTARFEASRWKGFIFGAISGTVMQSSSAAIAILASLIASGSLVLRGAMPIMSGFSVGNCVLVFLAAIDIKVATLYLVGMSAIALHFAKQDRRRNLFTLLLALGLIFFSLDVMKKGIQPLTAQPWFVEMITTWRSQPLLSAGIGLVLGFVAQSSSVVSMIGIGMMKVGLLDLPQTLVLMYGSVVGSTVFRILLMGASFSGSGRQIVRFQNIFNGAGAGVSFGLFYVEKYLQIPLVIAFIHWTQVTPEMQAAIAFLIMNLLSATLVTVGHTPLAEWLERTLPASREEELSRPKYIQAVTPEQSDAALELIRLEQAREAAHVAAMLAPARDPAATPDVGERRQALATLAKEVESAYLAIMAQPMDLKSSARLSYLQASQTLTIQLADAVAEFAGGYRGACQTEELKSIANSTFEAMEFLLISVEEALVVEDEEQRRLLLVLCEDRGPAMEQLRATYLKNSPGMTTADRANLMTLTAAVEKIVWLLRRLLAMRMPAENTAQSAKAT